MGPQVEKDKADFLISPLSRLFSRYSVFDPLNCLTSVSPFTAMDRVLLCSLGYQQAADPSAFLSELWCIPPYPSGCQSLFTASFSALLYRLPILQSFDLEWPLEKARR